MQDPSLLQLPWLLQVVAASQKVRVVFEVVTVSSSELAESFVVIEDCPAKVTEPDFKTYLVPEYELVRPARFTLSAQRVEFPLVVWFWNGELERVKEISLVSAWFAFGARTADTVVNTLSALAFEIVNDIHTPVDFDKSTDFCSKLAVTSTSSA